MKSIVTLAAITLLATTFVYADVFTKGGASQLVKSPTAQVQATTPAGACCGGCKSEVARSTTPAFKGTATKTAAVVERHACTSCGTKWVTTGEGKAKVETAVHTCGDCKR